MMVLIPNNPVKVAIKLKLEGTGVSNMAHPIIPLKINNINDQIISFRLWDSL